MTDWRVDGRVITLSSDFGSPYPAAMKGVIARETDARLVDVAHDFPRHDVRTAAFWLREVLPWFPPAVHLVVVDPGVGTDRAALAIRVGEHALVGPDNGVLLPPARALVGTVDGTEAGGEVDAVWESGGGTSVGGSTERIEAFEIEVSDPASHTFHGRDVFAPAAAAIHEVGVDALPEVDGLVRTSDYVDLSFPGPAVDEDGATGEVLVVDGFGNAITNLPGSLLADRYEGRLVVNGDSVTVRRSYAVVDEGERLVTVGSHGNVELSVNRGRGDEAFDVDVGSRVELTW